MMIVSNNLRTGMAIAVMAIVLSGCTMSHPPESYLPSKANIIPGETVTVSGSQNIYAVAKAHNVSMRELIVLNDLQPPFALRPGQTLVLPAANGGGMPISGGSMMPYGSNVGSAPSPTSAPSGAIEQSSLPPIQSAPVQSQQLAPPPVSPQGSLAPGGLVKPGRGSPAMETLNTPTTSAPAPVATTVAPSKSGGPVAMLAPPPAAASAAAPPSTSTEPPAPFSAAWPVQGPVLSGFGPKSGGLNNDGINIGAPKGSPVLAAAPGIVVYAGNEMKGFGNLILIRHADKWVTAYANLDRILVAKDAVVAQGDMIGTVGKTGNVPSPQLHFETRFDGKPIDPKSVIKGG